MIIKLRDVVKRLLSHLCQSLVNYVNYAMCGHFLFITVRAGTVVFQCAQTLCILKAEIVTVHNCTSLWNDVKVQTAL
jgi:hypothetical protein